MTQRGVPGSGIWDESRHDLLLNAKLAVPLTRRALVPRPRLLERLDVVRSNRICLISAPAGFGKTTLLSAWARASDLQVAWLALDEGDNEPARFLTYLTAALQRQQVDLAAELPALLHASPAVPTEVVLRLLLNRLSELPTELVLVLDDYHTVSEPTIHEGLLFLVEHLPPQIHLVVASRSDPPLPLARWRVRAELVELRASDLRFTAEEAAQFLNEIMGLRLTGSDVERLEEQTEGWIAALQLAAITLQGRADREDFIQSFSGGQRYILDYLGDEVLRRQPTQIRRFLLDTAILDRFSPALCEAVTEERDAHATLALLERANMFLVPLDDERQWYRYHRLFTDMLRAQLGREEPERARLLHARAAEWYERQGAPAEAMQHATAAEEWERVAQLVERFGGPMLASGEWATLLRWIDRLPDAFVRQRPQIGLFYAWALVLTGQWQTIEGRLHDVERCLGDSGWDGTATGEHSPLNAWRGQVAAIRGYLAAQQGDSGRAIQHSRLALVLLPEDDPIMRGVIALSLGTIYLSLGNVDESGRFLIEARTASQAGGNLATVLSANGALAQVYEEQGELRRAATIYREMIRLAPAPLPMLLHAHLRLGTIMYEWNDLGGAQEHLEQAMALARQFGAPELFALAALGLARLHYALGDVAAAGELVQQGEDRGRSVRQSLAGGYIAAHVARLRLLLREQEAALRWAEADADAGAGEQGLVGEMIELTLARVQLAYGAAGQALKRIEPLLRVAEAQGRTGRVVEMLVLQALALDGLQDQATAMAVLQRAVTLAEAHGYVRTFIDEGEPMRALLERAGKRRSVPRYAGVLVLAAERQGSRGAAPSTAIAEIFLPQDDDDADTSTHPALVEPLSEREREVLRLLAAGRSNREVAEALIVATGTIKKHINNIYGKLGVHSRTQAIARARELNLL